MDKNSREKVFILKKPRFNKCNKHRYSVSNGPFRISDFHDEIRRFSKMPIKIDLKCPLILNESNQFCFSSKKKESRYILC